MASNQSETSTEDFVISRVFDAPRELVWKAFTDPERMQHWWGPKGFTVIASKMDLRPGGTYHYGMKAPDGSTMWGKFTYREIDPPKRLVFINSFSDEAGGTTRHPLHSAWPLEMLSTFTFEDLGDKTRFTVRWAAYNATEDERKTFDTSHDSMRQGWGGTMDQLAAYLVQARV
ncbi:MAG: SRPBCC domain-containing protein [Methyloceanibacter sp.]